jgi:hypothetical protein
LFEQISKQLDHHYLRLNQCLQMSLTELERDLTILQPQDFQKLGLPADSNCNQPEQSGSSGIAVGDRYS